MLDDDMLGGLDSIKTVRDEDGTARVTLPKRVLEDSGVEKGEQVMILGEKDGLIILKPWSEEDVREAIGAEKNDE